MKERILKGRGGKSKEGGEEISEVKRREKKGRVINIILFVNISKDNEKYINLLYYSV